MELSANVCDCERVWARKMNGDYNSRSMALDTHTKSLGAYSAYYDVIGCCSH